MNPTAAASPRVAVLIPCLNEAAAIGKVVADFRSALPGASIHVFDNGSTDATIAQARQAGAHVASVSSRGKGEVVRRQFADVEADIYLMVDGDDTYDASAAPRLVAAVASGADMAVGLRVSRDGMAYRRGHAWGNRVLTRFLVRLFGRPCDDILSGYRAFSRRFVKSFPAHAAGFEIETELTVHALQMRMPMVEVATDYGVRADGSQSKLSTWKDGFRILKTILVLFGNERPTRCYGGIGIAAGSLAILLALPLFVTYLHTGLVPRFPTAILVAALMVLSALAILVGIVLEAISRARLEIRRMAYLRLPAPRLQNRDETAG